MKDYGRVQGSKESSQSLIIGKDTVYVHSNVKEIRLEEFDCTIYEYDEIQYEKDEYIKLMAEKNEELEAKLLKTQSALVEIYELI